MTEENELSVIEAKQELQNKIDEFREELKAFSANVEYKMRQYEDIAPNIKAQVKDSQDIILQAFKGAKEIDDKYEELRKDFEAPLEAIAELRAYFDENKRSLDNQLNHLQDDYISLIKRNASQDEAFSKRMLNAAKALSPELNEAYMARGAMIIRLWRKIDDPTYLDESDWDEFRCECVNELAKTKQYCSSFAS